MLDPLDVRGAIVVGTPGDALDVVLAAAAQHGFRELARHYVGEFESRPATQANLVVELQPAGAPNQGALDPEAVAVTVSALRKQGLSAVAGPRTAGHAIAWARHNAPLVYGPERAVCFPWTIADRTRLGRVVEIDPGAGFGSGGHPTTMLLLRRLAQLDIECVDVLDVGCGTGVLAIAAAFEGARSVAAVDIVPAAVEATTRNVEANGVADRVRIVAGSVAAVPGRYGVVVANIAAGVLGAIAADLRRATAPDGTLLVSGLSPAQQSVLSTSLNPMVQTWAGENADWVALGFAW